MEKCWSWWHVPVIPATMGNLKEKNGGSAWLGQKIRPYLPNNQSKKGLEA
jgi:hypothetical protein